MRAPLDTRRGRFAPGSVFRAPWRDFISGLERCLVGGGRALAAVFGGLAIGWWIYVPLHELLHAWGCMAAGGTVSRLQIDPLYFGSLLARLIPWVAAEGDYAGRLVGFDTGGSDLVYLATDLAPFVLTLFPGVFLLRMAGRHGRPWLFGAVLPFALAPFLSLTGDAYEIGSIVTTRLPPWSAELDLLRGDDLPQLLGNLAGRPAVIWLGAAVGALVGTLWAFAMYACGGLVARGLGYPETC